MRRLLLLGTLLLAAPALAEVPAEPVDATLIAEVGPPGPRPPEAEVEGRTLELSRRLRCPVCQGLSVADSPSESAVAMKNRIRELIAEGYHEEQIADYFVARYGEWVLMDPPREGNPLLWLAPGTAFGLGFAWFATVVARWRREEDDVPLPSDVGRAPRDPYEERLLAEIEE